MTADPVAQGHRIVLGVSGGIAAYKAVEVCRRLVDAGAHVAPVLTDGATRFVGAPPSRRWRPSRCRPRCGTSPTPSRTPGSARRADLVVVAPGHRPPARRLRRRHLRRPADRHPAGHPGAGASCARPCTPRCGSTRRCRTTWPLLRRRGRRTSSSPRSAAWPAATSGAGRLAEPADDRRPRVPGRRSGGPPAGPRRAAGARHRRRHPRADRPGPLHRQPLVGQAGLRRRRRGRGPRGATVTLVTTSPPGRAPAGRRGGRASRPRPRWSDAVLRPRRPAPTSSSWPPPSPTSGPKAAADHKIKKDDGPPELVLEPTADILAGLGARRRPGQVLVGFAAETDDAARARPADKLRAQGARPRRGQRRVARPASASSTTPTPCVILDGRRRSSTDVPLADKRAVAGAVLDAVVDRAQPHTQPTSRSNTVSRWTFTSESVTEGHPDKMADQISDAVLDAILAEDPMGRVACETLLTTGLVRRGRRDHHRRPTSTSRRSSARRSCDIGYDRDAVRLRRQHLRRASCRSTSSRPTSPRASTPPSRCAPARAARTSSTPRAPATRG